MRKRISLLIAALMLALTMSFGSVAAFAANAPAGCTKERGTIVCQQEEEGKNDKFTQETTISQKGSFQSSHEPVITEECQQDGQTRDKCPPGQFK
jgi:phosphate-selective porin